jgi:hypothetical protein
MRASEILRNLADLIDRAEAKQSNSAQAIQAVAPQQAPTQDQQSTLVAVKVPNTDNTEAGVFVPPLQAKLELLKKSVNVDSIYDQTGADEDLTGRGQDNEDELEQMKKMAGINPVVADEAGSDEPLDV